MKTKEEQKAYRKEYREKNREQIRANNKRWRQRNIEKVREKNREYAKRYYHEHKNDPEFIEKMREYHNLYVEKNSERVNANQRAYYLRKCEEKRLAEMGG